jgi:large subunit ribosomal protein L22
MEQAKAKLRNLNIAPRKVRLVATSLKGMHVQAALAQLDVMTQRSAAPISKLIRSAVANAKEKEMDVDKLIINSIRVDQGITLKRAKARARGRATLIEKKMSHIILELEEGEKAIAPEFVVQEKPKSDKADKKTKEERKEQAPKAKFEEPKKEKEKRGFGSKIFRRKSI